MLAGHTIAKTANVFDLPTSARNATTPPSATLGHSTFIAGLIAARAPGAEIVVQRVLDEEGKASSWAR